MFSFVKKPPSCFHWGCTILHSHQPRRRVPAAPGLAGPGHCQHSGFGPFQQVLECIFEVWAEVNFQGKHTYITSIRSRSNTWPVSQTPRHTLPERKPPLTVNAEDHVSIWFLQQWSQTEYSVFTLPQFLRFSFAHYYVYETRPFALCGLFQAFVTVLCRWNAQETLCPAVEACDVVCRWELSQIKLNARFCTSLLLHLSARLGSQNKHLCGLSTTPWGPKASQSNPTSLFSYQRCIEGAGCSRPSLILGFVRLSL